MKVGMIGYGAMAAFVAKELRTRHIAISCCIHREGRAEAAQKAIGFDVSLLVDLNQINELPDLFIDCSGHEGLREHGPKILQSGVSLVTASIGALADKATLDALRSAASTGKSQLLLVSGALGGLDALSAAQIGGLDQVQYTGTKPPAGWKGSAAEHVVALDNVSEASTHFVGTAGEAAIRFPKNANVAAAVALAGVGFDATEVRLIADPLALGNTHNVSASGTFGTFEFTITGNSLPDSPRTSALAAMSVVDRIRKKDQAIVI